MLRPASRRTTTRNRCFESQRKIGDIGFLSNIIENHDEPRGVSFYIPDGEVTPTSKKLLATMNVMLRGLPFHLSGTGNRYGKYGIHFH